MPERPQFAPGAQPAEDEEDETDDAEFEGYFEEAVVGVSNDEVDRRGDLEGGPLHAAPEGIVPIAEERAVRDELADLSPDGGASGECGIATENGGQIRKCQKEHDGEGEDCERGGDRDHEAHVGTGAAGDRKQEPQEQESGFDQPCSAGAAHDENEEEECKAQEASGPG